MSASFVVAIVLSISAANAVRPAVPVVQGLPPNCIPLPQQSISYSGSVSGCSSQTGGNPTCVAGEIVQFKYGDGVNACCPAGYVWQFEGAPINNGPSGTINHEFATPGKYTVTATVTSCNAVVVSTMVTVASASSIPTLSVTTT